MTGADAVPPPAAAPVPPEGPVPPAGRTPPAGQAPPAGRTPPAGPAPPRLDAGQLRAAQAETRASARRRYGAAARVLFALLDAVYGKGRSLSKFKVLELVARVPYQSWEQVAYIAITHVHDRVGLARRIHDRVVESRSQQDNEQWHLLVLEELIARAGVREDWLRFTLLPQIVAFAYYQLSAVLYIVRPAASYRLNADFEDHAEHEYAELVAEHPDWEETPFESAFASDYGSFASLADLFRQIGHDERFHKEASVARMREARFR
ncbi:MAG: alternative oxidase [Acidimicrobiales bacterium]